MLLRISRKNLHAHVEEIFFASQLVDHWGTLIPSKDQPTIDPPYYSFQSSTDDKAIEVIFGLVQLLQKNVS